MSVDSAGEISISSPPIGLRVFPAGGAEAMRDLARATAQRDVSAMFSTFGNVGLCHGHPSVWALVGLII